MYKELTYCRNASVMIHNVHQVANLLIQTVLCKFTIQWLSGLNCCLMKEGP